MGGPAVRGHRELIRIYKSRLEGKVSQCLGQINDAQCLLSKISEKTLFDYMSFACVSEIYMFKKVLVLEYFQLLRCLPQWIH